MAHQSIYDQIKKYQSIPHAWTNWAGYRFEMTNWIINETQAGSTALIIGAGACNDYDLVRLANHFSQITLLDFSEEEMKSAVEKQFNGMALSSNINYIAHTVTGISENDYRRFADILQAAVSLRGSKTDIEALSSLACKVMDETFAAREAFKYVFSENSFDYCLAFGVHSQINSTYPQIWEAFTTALEKSDLSVHMKAHELNGILIRELNSSLLTASVNGVLLGIEDSRLGVAGAVEGAYQATSDLNERIKSTSVDLISHQRALWPFYLCPADIEANASIPIVEFTEHSVPPVTPESKIYVMNWIYIKKK